MNGSGLGAGSFNARGSSGAGHGGRGGRGSSQLTTGAFYGDVFLPQSFGSTGGGGVTHGGGVIHIISTSMKIDGSIEVNGKNAISSSSYGGGSGGSILLDTDKIIGSGSIVANGGSGGTSGGGGGGSGGRISIYYNEYSFSGVCTAFGGDSRVEVGAAGTILRLKKQDNYRILEVNNKGRSPKIQVISDFSQLSTDSARTWLPLFYNGTEIKIPNVDMPLPVYQGYAFDELKLGGSAHLAVEPHFSDLVLHEFASVTGDFAGNSYGYLHIGPRQFVSLLKADYYIPVSFLVYSSGYLKLPPRVMLHRNSVMLDGYLVGVSDLTISMCTLNLGSSSAALTMGRFKTRHLKFDSVSVMSAGVLRMTDTKDKFILESKSVHVFTGGLIVASNFALISRTVNIDESGVINLSGQGPSCSVSSAYNGAGGSHAGYGEPGPGRHSMKPFDSVFAPSEFGGAGFGRSGHTCVGGNGGGIINMTIAAKLVIQGTISARYIINLFQFYYFKHFHLLTIIVLQIINTVLGCWPQDQRSSDFARPRIMVF